MKDLTTGNEGKLILNFTVPMLLGNIFQQLYTIINSIVVGKFIGKQALAAVGASFPIIFSLISLAIGIATGATIVIAQYFGAKDLKNVRKTIDTLYIFLFAASVIVTVLGIALSGPIFRLTKLPEDVLPQAKLYLNIYFTGMIFFFGFNGTSAILRGLGDSRTPLYFLVMATLSNIIFDLVFVIVFKWGIAGVAVSTIISQGGAFVTAILYLNKTHDIVKFSFRKLLFDWEIFRKSFNIGFPVGFQQAFVALSMIAMFWIVNPFGTDASAAYSVAVRIDSFASLPAMNFAMALATFVGQNLGANRADRAKKGFHATLLMTSGLSIFTTFVIIILRHPLMALFTNDQNVISIGENYLIIVGSFYVVFSTMFVVGGVMRGAGDTLIPMFITLFVLWVVRIPVSLWLSRTIGMSGIWWGIPIAWLLGLMMSYTYYLTGRWKTKAVVKYRSSQ
jgi:putative MATE family efflux protein